MMRLAMSSAASALLRALLARTEVPRDRVLLTEARSVDWHSLTFVGERHEFGFRIAGPDAQQLAARLSEGLEDAEFALPGQIVADVEVAPDRTVAADGSVCFRIEALTVAE